MTVSSGLPKVLLGYMLKQKMRIFLKLPEPTRWVSLGKADSAYIVQG